MNNNVIELNLNELELINGGMDKLIPIIPDFPERKPVPKPPKPVIFEPVVASV